MKADNCTGKTANPSGTSEIAAPALAATKISKTERSKLNGAWLESLSSAVISKVSQPQLTKVSALRCESITPFGTPVEPDVKRI
jgi:hypothetical protein